MTVSAEQLRRVRPEIAAIPLIVIVTFAFRAKSLTVGVGGDEFSLLAMAGVILEGGFPYAEFWDVRPPLAYLWGLPSAYMQDTVTAIKTLRLLALLAQGVAAWLFFCLFRRQLGSLAAALGVVALLASANMAELHHLAVPNHFAMAMSVGAFACAVEGFRRDLRGMYLASALLAGLLPWMMVHTGLAALAIGWLAISGAWSKRRWIGPWLAVAALPSITVFGVYFLWGPFDTFVRTVFLAPIDFVTEGFAAQRSFFPEREGSGATVSPALLQYLVLLLAGLAWLPRQVGEASAGSALRLSPYLLLPPMVPLMLMAYIKTAAPEYWIDAAPTAALLIAVAANRVLLFKAWSNIRVARYIRPSVLRACLAIYLWLGLAFLIYPWKETSEPALPSTYCESASWWIARLGPERTVLDTSAFCGYWVLDSRAFLHPPFTFTDNWFRQLRMRWVGEALSGDGSESTAAGRLRAAIGPASTAGIILADRRMYVELRKRQWHAPFFRDWKLVWFRNIDGYGLEDRFSTLAIFVRRDAFPEAGLQWP